uniref:C2H2-type domain-containing protein n=1 Tax=Triticum urartu TaxID=4572 RepID=A0A8R7PL97_TRIUA
MPELRPFLIPSWPTALLSHGSCAAAAPALCSPDGHSATAAAGRRGCQILPPLPVSSAGPLTVSCNSSCCDAFTLCARSLQPMAAPASVRDRRAPPLSRPPVRQASPASAFCCSLCPSSFGRHCPADGHVHPLHPEDRQAHCGPATPVRRRTPRSSSTSSRSELPRRAIARASSPLDPAGSNTRPAPLCFERKLKGLYVNSKHFLTY